MKICISAGELSGDEHAAGVVLAIKKLSPQASISGMGGSKLRSAGVNTVIDSEHSASVMGFGDVLKSLGKILETLSQLKTYIAESKPDLLILVDYPDFNLRIAKFAASLKIPVLYFIPPTIWAWRAYRINSIKRYVSRVALIYPFEKQHFIKQGYNQVYYVGHPFCDQVGIKTSQESKEAWLKRHGFDPSKPLLAILPGSRKGEIRKHLKLCIQSSDLLRNSHPELQFALGIAPNLSPTDFADELSAYNWITMLQGDTLGLLQHANVGLLKSGTSNLQAAFYGLPFVMFYKTSMFAEAIVKLFVNIKQYSPVNIIRNNSVLELTQRKASPNNIAQELERLLFDATYQSQIQQRLNEVRSALMQSESHALFTGATTAYERVANLALDLCA